MPYRKMRSVVDFLTFGIDFGPRQAENKVLAAVDDCKYGLSFERAPVNSRYLVGFAEDYDLLELVCPGIELL